MKSKLLTYTYLSICFLFIQKGSAQKNNNDFFEDSTWSVLAPLILSPDGQWAVVGKKFNDNPKPNQVFFINTATKKKKDLTHFSNFYKSLLNNGLVIGNIKKDLAIFSLNQNDSLIIKDIKKFDTSKDHNLLYYINSNNELLITKLNEALPRTKLKLLIKGINKYYLSPDSNTIIALNKKNELLYIDLKKFTYNKLLTIDAKIAYFKWNINQDGFVFKSDNKIHIVDLLTNHVNSIAIPDSGEIENLKLSFFMNNDLYFSYQINTSQVIKESDFVDIWQGNSKLLVHSNFKPKFEKVYKSFIYQNHNKKLIQLDRNIDKDYINIGIPGYLLSYNYFKDQEFNTYFPPIEYSLYDIQKKENVLSLASVNQKPFYPSVSGKYILYATNYNKSKWEILNISTLQKHTFNVDQPNIGGLLPIWSSDSETIIYPQYGNLYSYNIKSNKTIKLTKFKQKDSAVIGKIINTKSIPSFSKYIDTNSPVYLTINQDQKKYLYIYDQHKVKPVYNTDKHLSFNKTHNRSSSDDGTTHIFTIEDYNLPTKILSIQDKKISTLIESDIDKDLYSWRKRLDFTFFDKLNKKLHGYLFYPKNYNPKKKYPMIVQIYDLGLHSPYNEFSIPVPVASNSGFNSSLLTENDFFVLRAQTYVTEEGPGVSAVDCVTAAVNKSLEVEPSIDKDNLGLIGHSFGGYKAAAVSVLSNMFKASVAGAGAYDFIGGFMFRYSYYRKMPDWFMAENSQFNMGVKFSEDPEKYYRNSPILNAHKTQTAMLLFTGLQDENVNWENTRKMFIALKREQKPVIALFYKDIVHGISNIEPKENHDLSKRVLDWFDYHLQGKTNIPWIKKGLDYNTYSISPL
ncbi:alpha/beta hydrolase family protein [Myroides pelagicus]|uniref:Prolyl oligopeptidase family serine peptidase n=1 Tax=Myroides pelagicus TaxID=270914 RepID=A0A7K1GQQ0_9FLAO|nr:prolyl oligopeptidase family serine peptidase [Myroides pelagicus]MTH31030.1 prolyl oligopeptidase family serine peptidase [Myroides pelagicus]